MAASGLSCFRTPATTSGSSPESRSVQEAWIRNLDSLTTSVSALEAAALAITTDPAGLERAQSAFRAARRWYKSIEFAAAYYEPTTSKLLNGPALPRAEAEEGPEVVFPPEGFQVVEEMLFGEAPVEQQSELIEEIRNVSELISRVRNAISHQVVTDTHVWDAVKLGLARIATLGIAGFDSPVANDGIAESTTALQGLRATLAAYDTALIQADPYLATELDDAFASGIRTLSESTDADAFDRLVFIGTNVRTMATSIAAARAALRIAFPRERRGFRVDAPSVFSAGAFDPQAFGAPGSSTPSSAMISAGERLFVDRRLSGDQTRSCATCHDPARAFTDGVAKSPSLQGGTVLRNSPTLLNAGLQSGVFYDLRTAYLEDQVTEVVANASEMHGSVGQAASRLNADSSVVDAFRAAFGDSSPVVTGERIRLAIAAFVRSLTRLDSRIDRAMRGDFAALDQEERLGFNLFMGKARCGTCHFAPLFNGTVPPMYDDAEVEVLGVPRRAVVRGARLDPDSGRFRVTRSAPHLHAFKTPTVRNAALTAPYMHNGAYATLEDVVDFYDRGGGVGIGATVPNQTLPPDPLKLTPLERRALVRFMHALTDTSRTARPD